MNLKSQRATRWGGGGSWILEARSNGWENGISWLKQEHFFGIDVSLCNSGLDKKKELRTTWNQWNKRGQENVMSSRKEKTPQELELEIIGRRQKQSYVRKEVGNKLCLYFCLEQVAFLRLDFNNNMLKYSPTAWITFSLAKL